MGGDAWFGTMKSALARKGRNKAASSSTARAKKARQPEPETEQIPKLNWRKTEALCDQHEVWQEELYYEKMAGGLSSPDNALQVEKTIRLSEFRPLGVYKCFERLGLHDMENWKYTLTERIHILKDRKTGQVLFGVREDVPSLAEDLMEEEEEEGDTEEGESESETETEKATRRNKMLWDQNSRSNEIHNRRMTKLEEDQERHALAVQWAIQEEVNDRHRDAEARRRYDDWVCGRVFKDNPAPIPWEQVQPYQGGRIPFSYLKTHASRWVPLQVPPATFGAQRKWVIGFI
ncbi:hypothetical protein L1987_01391 [Smallanthus sonchifolius]|uniref:Uncharacterized protein n=1 Tax=Smallanthus sonchifolius TaxID=185202 RepID=A0ACB9K501_9ASTR|nr:hypothetical protein L1987_01391 [Smallanthus sonchifolius]